MEINWIQLEITQKIGKSVGITGNPVKNLEKSDSRTQRNQSGNQEKSYTLKLPVSDPSVIDYTGDHTPFTSKLDVLVRKLEHPTAPTIITQVHVICGHDKFLLTLFAAFLMHYQHFY